jgi:hypothetical protein
MIPADYDPMAEMPQWARSVPGMDHTGGWKPSQYQPRIGQIICQRVAAGMTMRQIAADPDMPSYVTIYHWLKLHADFANLYVRVRQRVAAVRLEERDAAKARAAYQARKAQMSRIWEDRLVPRDWGAGRRSGYSPALAQRFCRAIIAGGSLKTITARPGMPSVKQVYTWLRQHADFREAYLQARAEQRIGLALRADAVAVTATPDTAAIAKARIAQIEGRIGRLTPKVYRTGW